MTAAYFIFIPQITHRSAGYFRRFRSANYFPHSAFPQITNTLKTETKCYTPTLKTQATYLGAKGAYAVRQTCARTLKFTMYSSLMLSVFAHSFTLLPFSNSVLVKFTINTFTGTCPAVFLHILKYWYRQITTIMWLYNAQKLKKTYSFTVFSTLVVIQSGVRRNGAPASPTAPAGNYRTLNRL